MYREKKKKRKINIDNFLDIFSKERQKASLPLLSTFWEKNIWLKLERPYGIRIWKSCVNTAEKPGSLVSVR
jgi:hypothetical protein